MLPARLGIGVCILLGLPGVVAEVEASVLVEDFTSGSGSVVIDHSLTSNELVQTGLAAESSLLGRRKFSLAWGGIPSEPAYSIRAEVLTGNGGSFVLDGSGGPAWGQPGSSVGVLRLELGDPNATPGLAEDLTVGGVDTLRIAVQSSSLTNTSINGNFTFQVTVTSTTSKMVLIPVPPSAQPQVIDVPFSAFTGVDFTQVKAINLNAFNITSGGTLAVDSISAVPEPGSAALAGVTAITLLRRRRR